MNEDEPPKLKVEELLPDELTQLGEICLKGTKNIRDALKMSEGHYLLISPLGTSVPKDYYLYAAMDEVEKAGMAMLANSEFITGDFPEEEDRVIRNLAQQAIDGQMLWIRKLTEILAEMVLFTSTNTEEYYLHYLLVNELVRVRSAIKNSQDVYGSIVENYKQQEANLVSQISQMEQSNIDTSKCWYLKKNKNGTRVSGVEKRQLSPFTDRLSSVFEVSSIQQLIALGLSYHEGYGHYSSSIHFSAGDLNSGRVDRSKSIKRNIAGISVLAANIVIQARTLLGNNPEKGFVASLTKIFDENSTYQTQINRHRIKPNIKINDFVVANGDLAQVVQVFEGKYKFRSFKLRFLLKSDITTAGEGPKKTVWTHQNPEYEYFPAMFVGKLIDYEDKLSQVRKEILLHDKKANIDDKKLGQYLTESVIDTWNAGLREHMHSIIWKKPSEPADKDKQTT